MVNEELVGGLISAMTRGESLQKAMNSFYQAGYNKAEIEEAAKIVQRKNIKPLTQKLPQTSQKKSIQQTNKNLKQTPKSDSQNKKKFKILLIIVGIVVAFLIIGLILAFIFKDKISTLF